MKVSKSSGIKIYSFEEECSIENALALFKEKKLTEITTPAPPHSGM